MELPEQKAGTEICLRFLYLLFIIKSYFSTISRTSIGHALTQIPQAVHLDAVGLSSAFTITPKGQTSTHLPQPVQSFLLIM